MARRYGLPRIGPAAVTGPDGESTTARRAVARAVRIAGADAVRVVLTGDRRPADRILADLGMDPLPGAVLRVAARPGMMVAGRDRRRREEPSPPRPGAPATKAPRRHRVCAEPRRGGGSKRSGAGGPARPAPAGVCRAPRRVPVRERPPDLRALPRPERSRRTRARPWPHGTVGARLAPRRRAPGPRRDGHRSRRAAGGAGSVRDRAIAVLVPRPVVARVGRAGPCGGRRAYLGSDRAPGAARAEGIGGGSRARGRHRPRRSRRVRAGGARDGAGARALRSRAGAAAGPGRPRRVRGRGEGAPIRHRHGGRSNARPGRASRARSPGSTRAGRCCAGSRAGP